MMVRICLGFFLGIASFSVFAQNIGIGRPNPAFRLDVLSSNNTPARFEGIAPMMVGLSEDGVSRGYIGSFSGQASDVDFGTVATNTTGRLHLTLQAIPRLTIRENGFVGINTTNPQQQLDVDGHVRLNGRLFLGASSGLQGQVLTSGGPSGLPSWQTLSSSSGAFSKNIRFGIEINSVSTNGQYNPSRSVLFNTNPTAVSTPVNADFVINEGGLYHLEGNLVFEVEFGGQLIADNTNVTGILSIGSTVFETHYANTFKKKGTGANWRGKELFVWSKDVYIHPDEVPVPIIYGYLFNFNPDNGASLQGVAMSGTITGYKIAD